MNLINYQPWQYFSYCIESVRESWNKPSESCLESLIRITQVALAALASIPAFLLDLLVMPFSLSYRWAYPTQTIERVEPSPVSETIEETAPRVLELDEFHGLVDVHAPDGVPDAWLIGEINRAPYAEPPADLEYVQFFSDSMREALKFLAPHARLHYVDLFRNQGVPAEGDARIEVYTYSASCLTAHHCRYPSALRDEDPLYAAFQELPLLDKALVLLRLIAPEKEWRLTELARNLIQLIQAKAHDMSRDQFFLRLVMAPVALDPVLYPLEP